jgi:thiamine pyrophosphate-dependent acetolactate synthase large subunit-like protein
MPIASTADSAGTDRWKLPPHVGEPKLISLNIDGTDVANNYPTEAVLVGDAKATPG